MSFQIYFYAATTPQMKKYRKNSECFGIKKDIKLSENIFLFRNSNLKKILILLLAELQIIM
jgi:hypothetical protein